MLIAIEGLDGSGKQTQAELLSKALKNDKGENNVISLSYPKYGSPCCIGVEKYLKGDFGQKPEDVNAYTASMFYALDRYADYAENWGKHYTEGMYVVADRYVQSNMIYQLTKLPKSEWDTYIRWLENLEYKYNGLPKPDLTIYLFIPIEISQRLMTERYIGDETKKDIHEKNVEFLQKCFNVADYLSKRQGWKIIDCTNSDGTLKSKEEIAARVYAVIKSKEKAISFNVNIT